MLRVSIPDLIRKLPSYEDRRKVMSSDAFASVDGFRATVLLTYEHLFGMRLCNHCPNCSSSPHTPGQYLFGSNAESDGGIFGRIDAGYSSIEAQNYSGSLHAHSQLFVQCLHQHTSLREILAMVRKDGDEIVTDYLKYNAWVCRQVHMTPEEQLHADLSECEKQWPEFKEDTHLISTPNYLLRKTTKYLGLLILHVYPLLV